MILKTLSDAPGSALSGKLFDVSDSPDFTATDSMTIKIGDVAADNEVAKVTNLRDLPNGDHIDFFARGATFRLYFSVHHRKTVNGPFD